MKKALVLLAFTGLLAGTAFAGNNGDDKDKKAKKECCKKGKKACAGEKKEGCNKEKKSCCKKKSEEAKS
ncbi:MAG: hypothetical protein AB7O73_02340 [Bacteroidia bacterium]